MINMLENSKSNFKETLFSYLINIHLELLQIISSFQPSGET